ncbi:MAG: NADH:ubiquinone oxidoreductase subunit NDUFA12 [Pseudomonadota bacterium]
MSLLSQLFTWWNGQTLGTRLFTMRHGEKVGEDEAGNCFYQTANGARRWVIYNGVSEASRVSPDWHGWLHYTYDEPPSKAPLKRKSWERPHKPNLTGTEGAYRPPGSIAPGAVPAGRAEPRRDYDAWSPEG